MTKFVIEKIFDTYLIWENIMFAHLIDIWFEKKICVVLWERYLNWEKLLVCLFDWYLIWLKKYVLVFEHYLIWEFFLALHYLIPTWFGQLGQEIFDNYLIWEKFQLAYLMYIWIDKVKCYLPTPRLDWNSVGFNLETETLIVSHWD